MTYKATHKLIDVYANCQTQSEHDKIQYLVFNPVIVFKSFYYALTFSCVDNLAMSWELPNEKNITKICKN